MQDLDELKHVFLICAEFEVKKKTTVSSFHKESNFKPCLTKQLLNMFKLWCEWGIRLAIYLSLLMLFYCLYYKVMHSISLHQQFQEIIIPTPRKQKF